MAAFNPDKYAPVEDRIAEFYRDYPQGSIRTFIANLAEKSIVIEARAYRSNEEAEKGIYTSGFAREVEGSGPVNKTNHVENCETSAIGRALANLNYPGAVDGKRAPRPSREEMEAANARREADEHHARMLEFCKSIGERSDEDVTVTLFGEKRPLRAYMRDSWSKMKADPRAARTFVDAIERDLGEKFA